MGSLLVFLAIVAAAAIFGAQFQPGAWYEALDKAPWNPPNWVFASVWSALYLGIAVAGWRVWRSRAASRRVALELWTAQLALNALWSWLFFGRQRPDLSLVDIVLLLAVIVAFLVVSVRVDRIAAWLFVPYAIWVAYATSLNLYIVLKNSLP